MTRPRCFFSRSGRLLCCIALAASAPWALGRQALEERTEANFAFGRDGAFTLENSDGSIRIYCWKEPKVKLVALRKAYTKPRLDQIQVEINPQPESISVQTRIASAAGFFAERSGTVDYTVIVPETAKREKLRIVNGEIVI